MEPNPIEVAEVVKTRWPSKVVKDTITTEAIRAGFGIVLTVVMTVLTNRKASKAQTPTYIIIKEPTSTEE